MILEPELAYWTIRIDDAQTREAFTLERANQIFDELCQRLPEATITLCEVWIKPVVMQRKATDE